MKIYILVLCILQFSSCSSNKDKSSFTKQNILDSSMKSNIDIFIPVRLIKQPKSMDCWATALTILYSWKNNDQNISIENVIKKYGDFYYDLYINNSGIMDFEELELYKKVHFKVIQGENPSINRWFGILKNNGPLSVTVAIKTVDNPPKRYIHALVINGLKGDGSSNATTIDYVDPGDGLQHSLKFTEFLSLYEGSNNWPLQIIHW